MKNKLRPGLLALNIVIPLFIGGISAMLTGDMMKEYFFLNKPPLSPPGWVFPIMWTVLYVLMGLAMYLVITLSDDRKQTGMAGLFYGIQLVLNFFWSILFFNYSLYLWSFIELIVMMAAVLVTTVLFFRVNKTAGFLMIPYILWLSFAAYLNFAVYEMSLIPAIMPR